MQVWMSLNYSRSIWGGKNSKITPEKLMEGGENKKKIKISLTVLGDEAISSLFVLAGGISKSCSQILRSPS